MIKSWLSRYNLRYPRSLAYMLQASEYNIRDYLDWYHSADDFTRIERRKSFVGTAKGVLLLVAVWLIALLTIILSVVFLLFGVGTARYLLPALMITLLPHIMAYGLIVPLVFIKVFVQRPIEYLEIKKAQRKLKGHKAVKIGIAGSFGKTTMREILRTVLAEGKKVAAPPHSYNTPMSIGRFIDGLKGDEDILVFEFGEYYPGDIRKLCDLVDPDMGIITGVNEAHLKKSESLDKTVGMVFELADHLGIRPVYVNGESELARKNARPGHILYNQKRVGEWRINKQSTDLTGTSFVMEKGERRLELDSTLLGLHQVGPIAAVVNISLILGLSLEQVKIGVAKTRPFDHRLQPTIDDSGVIILDDSYNGNPDGVKAVLSFLSSLKGYRRFYITPGLVEMGHRTEEVHRSIGRNLAKAGIEKIVLIRNSVTPYIEQGLKEEEYGGEVMWFDDGPSAFVALPLLTVKGDIVLLQNDWTDQYK